MSLTFPTLIHFAGAILIAYVWLSHLHKLDFFRPEPWTQLITVFVLGCLSPLLVFLAHDLEFTFGLSLTGDKGNDLVFSILEIGVIEEISKVTPLLIGLLIFKTHEPSDYMVYAAASAIGFATTENVMYFENHGSGIIVGRALMSAFGHIVDLAFVGYLMMWARFRKNWNQWLMILPGILIGSVMHGFYDFFLINPSFGFGGLFLTMLVFLIGVELWAVMLNNSLNNSPEYDPLKYYNSAELQMELMRNFGFLILLQFAGLVLEEGFDKGIVGGAFIMVIEAFIFMVLALRISHFEVIPGKWNWVIPRLPFSFLGRFKNGQMDFGHGGIVSVRGAEFNEADYTPMIGHRFYGRPIGKGSKIKNNFFLSVEGKIFPGNNEIMYLSKLEEAWSIDGKETYTVVLFPKTQGESYFQGFPAMGVRVVPSGTDLSNIEKVSKFPFMGWIIMVPETDANM